MKGICKNSIVMLMVVLMVLSTITGISVAASGVEYTAILSQDFEGYTVYNSADGSGTYGGGGLGSGEEKQSVTGGNQYVIQGDGGSGNGLLSITQEAGGNKYLEGRAKSGVYPTYILELSKAQTGGDVRLTFDYYTGDGRLYMRPHFSNEAGGNTKQIENFLQVFPIEVENTYGYFNYNNTVNNDTTKLTLPRDKWIQAEIHFNMETLTYTAVFKNRDTGETLGTMSEKPLPTPSNGSGTPEEVYGTRKYLRQLEFVQVSTTAQGSLDGGIEEPLRLDNISVSVPKEQTPVTWKSILSQDFEGYTVYNSADGSGTYGGSGLGTGDERKPVTGGMQYVMQGDGGAGNGLLSVAQEADGNKYLEGRGKSGVYPTLMLDMSTAQTGNDILVEFDYYAGGGRLYMRPHFSNEAGNDGKQIENFFQVFPIDVENTYGYFNYNGTVNNDVTKLTIPRDVWVKAEIHFDMEKLTYLAVLKNRDTGAMIGEMPEKPLPTPSNGSGTPADIYGARKYLKQLEFVHINTTASGSLNGGTDEPMRLDNIRVFVPSEETGNSVTLSVTGEGTVTLGGETLADGGSAAVAEGGNQLVIAPADGYEIESITVGEDVRTVTDRTYYTEMLMITEDTMLAVVFVQAAPSVRKTLISQNFEGYTIYNSEDKTGTYGMALTENLRYGRQAVYAPQEMVDGTTGLLAIRQEEGNKYLEWCAQKNIYPCVGYSLNTSVTGDDIILETDFSLGDSTLYIRPTFTDKDGNNAKEITNFIVMTPSITSAYYYAANGNNSANQPASPQGWARAVIHFNMEKLTYRVEFKDMSGHVIGSIPESALPTPSNGSGTQEEIYNSRKYLRQINFTARCDANAVTGSSKPLKTDNVLLAVVDEPCQIEASIQGSGTVSVDGAAVTDGQTVSVSTAGTDIEITPAEGYQIGSVTLGGQKLSVTDPKGFHERIYIEQGGRLEVVFVQGYQLSVSISGGTGEAAIDGVAIANGETVAVAGNGAQLRVVPDEGFRIAGILFGGEPLTVSDPYLFTGTLTPSGDTTLQITYQIEDDSGIVNQFFVALDGDDESDGSEEHPFATLERARDAIREYNATGVLPAGGVTVYLRGGTYYIDQSFTLGAQDSGTADSPIVYRNYPGEKVTLSGGLDIDFSKFQPVQGEMRSLLRSEEARDKVVVADLDEIGIGEMPQIPINNHSALKLPLFLFDGQVLKISQWPNSDVTSSNWPVAHTVNRGFAERYPADDPQNGTGLSKIRYDDDIPSTWRHNPSDILWLGFWRFEWYSEYFYGTHDPQAKTVEATHSLLYGVDDAQFQANGGIPFKAYNVYEEIDEPGEWYIDRAANKMYFYPYETSSAAPKFKMTQKDFDLVKMTDTTYITLRGIELTAGKKMAVSISGGTGNLVDRCDINTFESMGVSISGGTDNGIANSEIYDCGTGGVFLDGGDRETITPAGNYVHNNTLHDWSLMKASYGPGVQLDGVGNIVSHNEFYNAPHAAIIFNGVENVMEYNVFHDVVMHAADMGAIYTGRDLSDHGNTVRYNYFYNIGNQLGSVNASNAVFTDDASCDLVCFGNVFGHGIQSGEALKIHGGMNNIFRNNLFVDVPKIMWTVNWQDGRFENSVSKGDAGYDQAAEQTLKNTWEEIKGNQAYYDRWPWLESMEDMDTFVYQSNVLGNNVFAYVNEKKDARPIRILRELSEAEVLAEQKTNLFWEKSPETIKGYFKDYDGGNFALTDEAYTVIREKIPEFAEIPFEQMGRLDTVNTTPAARQVDVTFGDGRVLNGNYLFDDPQRDREGETVYRWLISDTKDGNYQPISGATGKSYAYTDDQAGYYIKFEVTPVNSSGIRGVTVQSAGICLVTDAQSLSIMIAGMEETLGSAQAGTGLGQYPTQTIAALEAALAEAKAHLDGTEVEIMSAAEALDRAYETFKEQQVTTLTSDLASGTLTIPQGLRRLELNLTDVSGEILLNAAGGLPAGTMVNAVVRGVGVKIEIPNTTPAGTMTLIKALSEPGAIVFGEAYASFSVGLLGGPFAITVSGGAGKNAFLIKDSVASAISDAANHNGDKTFTIESAGEVLLAQMYTPSNDATLSEITVDGKTISRFSPEKESYSYTVAADNAGVVSAKTTDENATAAIEQTSIPGTAKITVTAQDGVTTKVYTVRLSRKSEPTPVVTAPPHTGPSGNQGSTTGGAANTGFGLFTEDTKTSFADIAGHWAMNDIEAMAVKGIVNGVTATTFEPDRAITRAEFATLLVKGLGLTSSATTGFMDVQTGGWYAPYVNAAANAGLIVGYDGNFRPDDLITREEMAVIIAKAYAFRGGKAAAGSIGKFADIADISDWARSYVDTVTSAGLISGMTEDTFVPQDNATRAQAVSLLKRLLDLI